MLSYEEALARMLARAQPVARRERVDTLAATGRVLAEALIAPVNVPPADNSAMDGYLLRAQDVPSAGTRLPVSQRIPAGSQPQPLQPGTAARIFTGAVIPPGGDAVVMQERCEAEGEHVRVNVQPAAGDNIRRAGEDIARGAEVLAPGLRLRAAHAGLVASLGIPTLEVFARLRVAVFFTGDELIMPGEPLRDGAIYNSNRYVLHGLLAEQGCVVSDLGTVPDDLQITRDTLRRAAEGHDLILTCGGVSVGEEDHVKAALQAEGELDAWKVNIKPGKPLAMGRVGSTPFVGLPGNPVSSFATFHVLVKPYLRRLQGMTDVMPRPLRLRADFAVGKRDPRRDFLRVRRNAAGGLDLFPKQGSGVLTSCAWGDGFVSNPPDTAIQLGDLVDYLPFED